MTRRLTPVDLAEDPVGVPYSQGMHDGRWLFVAGQLPADDPAWRGPAGVIEAETRAAMDRIGRVLAAAGIGFDDVARVGIFMTDLDQFDRMNAVYRRYFSGPALPARTTVGVAKLLHGAMIEIDCVARLPVA
jgi:2-iminobutanoate/2-iminopropanoate deaminase